MTTHPPRASVPIDSARDRGRHGLKVPVVQVAQGAKRENF